jgi:hypothetical protein
MAADMSGEQMQAKITAARREAEGLKDKIKRRKDELADTTRTNPFTSLLPTFNSWNGSSLFTIIAFAKVSCSFRLLTPLNSSSGCAEPDRRPSSHRDEASTNAQRPPGQDLRHALVN